MIINVSGYEIEAWVSYEPGSRHSFVSEGSPESLDYEILFIDGEEFTGFTEEMVENFLDEDKVDDAILQAVRNEY